MGFYSVGVTFLNQLSFARKFQVILLTLLLPIMYSSWLIYLNEKAEVDTVNLEIQGAQALDGIHALRIIGAKHRGALAQWQAGDKGQRSNITSLEEEMSKRLKLVKQDLNSATFSQDARKQRDNLATTWHALSLNELESDNAAGSFNDHTQWINSVNVLVDTVSIESSLILDSHMDTYLLMQLTVFNIPKIQEHLGRLRGKGAGVATKGGFDSASFVFVSTLYDSINIGMQKVVNQFKEVRKSHPEHVSIVQSALAEAVAAVGDFEHITKSKLLDPDAPTVSGTDYFNTGTHAIVSLSKLYKLNDQVFKGALQGYKSEAVNRLIIIFSIYGFLLLAAIYLFTCLKKSVDANIGITQGMAADLERSVLNGEYVSQSKDELGDTVGALNSAYSQLRKVVCQVRENSSILFSSSSELKVVSKKVDNLGESQKTKVGIIVTASTQLAATAKEVASHCDNAANETKNAQAQAVAGASRSQASAKVIRELAVSIRKAGDEIGQLAQQAASISTVIDVIKAIAEQTNLLALNAAIEAARAGEQGRGFAVVADEVRTLANRTQDSTNEIESTISSLQLVAEQAVSAMDIACEQATSGENEAIQTGEMLAEIEQSVSLVSDLILQVATAGEQQAGAAEEISVHIHGVNESSTDLVDKARAVSVIADDVATGSSRLEDTVQQFKV